MVFLINSICVVGVLLLVFCSSLFVDSSGFVCCCSLLLLVCCVFVFTVVVVVPWFLLLLSPTCFPFLSLLVAVLGLVVVFPGELVVVSP